MLLLLALTAVAGSLDLLEVGGLWGTPTATGPTAVWFNPAALSFERGTRFLAEADLALGGFAIDRDEPDYTFDPPARCDDDPSGAGCARPVYGGLDRVRFTGAVPFLGVATNANVPGLGLGLALYVPMARGGDEVDEPGAGRTHLRRGDIQAIHTSLAVSYAWKDLFGVGASLTWIRSSWAARIDNQTATSFRDYPGVGGLLAGELDGVSVEDPSLLAQTDFGPLIDDIVSFQVGLYAKPHPDVRLSVGYAHGGRVSHEGPVSLAFSCPDPDVYPLLGGPLGAPNFGVCDAQMSGRSTVAYRYPMRVHGGVAWAPEAGHRVELMGGWVRWSQYTDFEITVSDVTSSNTELSDDTRDALALDRRWARDNRDTFWVGVDGKVRAHKALLVGGRVTFDRSAVPDAVMSPNNADFDTVRLGALVAVTPSPKAPVQIGLSYLGDIQLPRETTHSAFRVDVDPALRLEDRYLYPEMNGSWTGWLHRVGLSVQGAFDTRRKER